MSKDLQNSDLLARYGKAVPRYTSYPTAPHFSTEVSEEAYRDRLSHLPVSDPVSLYIHIPYCDTLCWFCGCHTKITQRYEPVSSYVEVLCKELELLAAALPAGTRMSHMHWGGGSPTYLSAEDSVTLAKAAQAAFAPSAEFDFAVEIDPRETGADRVAALAGAGLTRASIGVQDFDPIVQKAINRHQSYEETAAVVAELRTHGVNSLNLDLMYGLPHQTLERTLSTIEQALTLRPDRVAIFGYAHVPWMKTHMKMIPEEALPGPAERLEAATAATEVLVKAGYVQIGLDHFALPEDSMTRAMQDGTLRRNFQGYTTDMAETLLPVGASSIGKLPDMFVQNEPSLKSHTRMVEEGHLPIKKGAVLSLDDRLRAAVIERIMCDFAVDLSAVCAGFGASMADLSDADPLLDQMIEDGLVTRKGGDLTVNEIGRPYVRQVAACFDRYFSRGTARHSAAV